MPSWSGALYFYMSHDKFQQYNLTADINVDPFHL